MIGIFGDGFYEQEHLFGLAPTRRVWIGEIKEPHPESLVPPTCLKNREAPVAVSLLD